MPDGFTFCLKFPRAITHEKQLVGCEEETARFLDRLRILDDKAAPAFLQFPARFSRDRHGLQLATYLDWLAPRSDGMRLGVEVRAVDLHTPEFAAFLAERGLSLLLVDRINTPDMFDVWYDLVKGNRAPDFCVIRWIGDDLDGPQGDRELSAPRDKDLLRWRDRLVALHNAGVHVYGYMHNPYEGHSPASVRRLENLVRSKLDLPLWSPAPSGDEQSDQLPLFGDEDFG